MRFFSVNSLHVTTLLVAACWSSGVLRGADPVLVGLQPPGLQRGTDVVVRMSGARLGDAQDLLWYRTGIQVREVKPISEGEIDVSLAVAPDCPLGFHGVRVRTASGISNLHTISVGALPEITESEPNSDFSQPQEIPLGCTVNGVITNEDVDYFVVEARAGQRLVVEVEGVRLGMPPNDATFFDPFAAILDTRRFELSRSDDSPLLQQDCLCGIVAPEDGRYVIEVRESSFRGNDLCKYRLHVGSFPRPTAVVPAGGRPGETVTVRWLGDPLGEFQSVITLPTDGAVEHDLYPEDEQGIAPSPLRVRVSDLENVLEVEPNDARESATSFAAPAAVNGLLQRPGDVDHFRFAARQGEQYDVRVYARSPLRSPLDSVLTIIRSGGAGVASNDDTGGPDSYLRFQAPEDDEYVIVVGDQLGDGGLDFVYRVEVTPVRGTLRLSLPERVQYVPVTVSVPKGNRMAVMVDVARGDFGGDVEVGLVGLPPGMTAGPVQIPAQQTSVPLLFTAAGEAATGGALVGLLGTQLNADNPVTGHLHQRTMLVRGQNNVDVWGHNAQRMAVALTEEAPFILEVVQPQAPLVRSGSMQLTVRAQRREGFSEAIAVSLLYNPPGIGSSGSVSIAGDQTEAAIPLTANGSAALGTWPLIVLGRANVNGGALETASQQADLEIADTFFDLTIEKAAGELGQQAEVLVRIAKKRDFPGPAKVSLVGLPAKTTLVNPEPLEFGPDTQELVFPVAIEADARPGKYQTLVCQAIVTVNGEPVPHTLGAGELRIDQPLPPKEEAASPTPTAAPEAPPAEAPPKRLSRLEQLRLEKQQPSDTPSEQQ